MRHGANTTRILLLCATRRGRAFVEQAFRLMPEARFTVCTFREEAWEPPFLQSIEDLVKGNGQRFVACKDVEKANVFEAGEFDLLFAVNWRYMVPAAVYKRMRRGAYVFHDSLLPKYRGFSPTVWAILNGESETGVTLFEMEDSVDRGRIIDQAAVPIGPAEFVATVIERVTEAYLLMLDRNLAGLLAGNVPLRVQNESDATYACKRVPDDNRIDWTWSARRVFDMIRACSRPYSGAYCFLGGKKLTVWTADCPNDSRHYVGSVPGRVVERLNARGAGVLAGTSSIFLRDVQLDEGPIVTADTALSGLSQTLS